MDVFLEIAINVVLLFLGLFAIIVIADSFDGENTKELRRKMRDEWDEEYRRLLEEEVE